MARYLFTHPALRVAVRVTRRAEMLARSAAAKERRVKERLDDYNRRNFGVRSVAHCAQQSVRSRGPFSAVHTRAPLAAR
jgi:hypothetical protein